MALLDSFSGAASDLKGAQRTPDAVLQVLRTKPRVSCFDMTEHGWLRMCIAELVRRGAIRHDGSEPYPWIRYIVLEQPKAEAAQGEVSGG